MTIQHVIQTFEQTDMTNPNKEKIAKLWETYDAPLAILHIRLIPIYEILQSITNTQTLHNFSVRLYNYTTCDNLVFEPVCITGADDTAFEILILPNEQKHEYIVSYYDDNTKKQLFSAKRLPWITTFLNNVNLDELETACEAVEAQANQEIEQLTRELAEIQAETKELQQEYDMQKEKLWIQQHHGKKPLS